MTPIGRRRCGIFGRVQFCYSQLFRLRDTIIRQTLAFQNGHGGYREHRSIGDTEIGQSSRAHYIRVRYGGYRQPSQREITPAAGDFIEDVNMLRICLGNADRRQDFRRPQRRFV